MIAAQIVQADPGVDIDIGTTGGLLGGAVGAFLTTLVVGAILSICIGAAGFGAVLRDYFG